MRRFKFLFFFIAGVFILSSPMVRMTFGGEKISKRYLVIDTPKKKSNGKVTWVSFTHASHAKRSAKGDCQICHSTIKQALNASENNKNDVHKACKTCHKKGKAAASYAKCKSCHIPK